MRSTRIRIIIGVISALLFPLASTADGPPPTRPAILFLLQAADGDDFYVCILGASQDQVNTFRLFTGPSKAMKGVTIEHALQSQYNGGRYVETRSAILYIPWHDREKVQNIPRFDPYWPLQTRSDDPKWGEMPLVLLEARTYSAAESDGRLTLTPK